MTTPQEPWGRIQAEIRGRRLAVYDDLMNGAPVDLAEPENQNALGWLIFHRLVHHDEGRYVTRPFLEARDQWQKNGPEKAIAIESNLPIIVTQMTATEAVIPPPPPPPPPAFYNGTKGTEEQEHAPKAKLWPLDEARRLAKHLQNELASLCERIDVAGSIRRGRSPVHDVDLVLLIDPANREPLEKRIRANANIRILRNGPEVMAFLLHNGLQVDLYFATPAESDLLETRPTNFGMRLLAMTGSAAHNIKLAALAKSKGLHFHPYRGILAGGHYERDATGPPDEPPAERYVGGHVAACETERDIFAALGLDFIPPEAREA